jgi:hypothetical protein
MLSNESYNVNANPSTSPSSQAALTYYDPENARELTPSNGAEGLDRADVPSDTAVVVEPCS